MELFNGAYAFIALGVIAYLCTSTRVSAPEGLSWAISAYCAIVLVYQWHAAPYRAADLSLILFLAVFTAAGAALAARRVYAK